MNFEIRDDVKPVEGYSEDVEDVPCSAGFWYSIEEGYQDMFIDLLKDEETKRKCQEAVSILSKLERAVEDYVIWM